MTDVTTTGPPTLPDIITRYLNGESMLTLATESRVSARTLYYWMLKELGPRYKDVQQQALISRIADADVMLLEATDHLQVARAREIARFSRMDYERRFPAEFGLKNETITRKQIVIVVDRSCGITPTLPAPDPLDVGAAEE